MKLLNLLAVVALLAVVTIEASELPAAAKAPSQFGWKTLLACGVGKSLALVPAVMMAAISAGNFFSTKKATLDRINFLTSLAAIAVIGNSAWGTFKKAHTAYQKPDIQKA